MTPSAPDRRRAPDPPRGAVVEAVGRALAEDLTPLGDLTSALLDTDLVARACFVSRAEGVLAGRACADETFVQLDPRVELTWSVVDGDRIAAGTALAAIVGPLASVLTGERTALNFLGHLSGIATLARRFVDAAADGGPSRIWDTRKTTPGLRALEKAAVRAGGAANHRGGLSDWILLKDNHLARVGIPAAVVDARSMWPGRTVHVECDTLAQAVAATEVGADALLLDNMEPGELIRCIQATEETAVAAGRHRPLLEASGGITLDTVAAIAATGVDYISVGALTNSAPVLDIGLDIEVA